MAKLTDRQQRIKDLFREGKNAREIAKILNITPNGVYQQRRRIREIEGGGSRSRSRTGGRQSARQGGTGSSALLGGNGTPTPAPEHHHDTPLQAIRRRRAEISAQVKLAADELTAAQRDLRTAQEAHDKIQGRHAEEMKQLDKAEQALTGKPVVRPARNRPKPSGSKNGAKAATGAQGGSQGAPSPSGDGEGAGQHEEGAGKPEGAGANA